MDSIELAKTVTAILSPYLIVGAEQFAKEVGKETYQKIANLKNWLWNKINHSRNEKLIKTADLFENDPDTFQSAMISLLNNHFEQHPKEVQELVKLIAFKNEDQNSSKSSVKVQGDVIGMIVGDRGTIHQTFNKEKK